MPEDPTKMPADELRALRSRLQEIIDQIDRSIEDLTPGRSRGLDDHPPIAEYKKGPRAEGLGRRGRPVRALVLDSLDDLGWPMYTRELALYCQARYGRRIEATRFGTLANDEVKAFQNAKRPRSVWICFALTFDRAEPIKRLLCRSDWPIEQRIVAPTTGRIQHLKMTVRLCELAMGGVAQDEEMMRIIAADHVRDVPGIEFQRGRFELERWRDVASKHLSQLEQKDRDLRQEAAERWARALGEAQLLFGRPEMVAGSGDDAVADRRRS